MTGTCLRCGRKLTNPSSAKRGYGGTCYKKLEAEKKQVKETKEEINEINFVDELRDKVS